MNSRTPEQALAEARAGIDDMSEEDVRLQLDMQLGLKWTAYQRLGEVEAVFAQLAESAERHNGHYALVPFDVLTQLGRALDVAVPWENES